MGHYHRLTLMEREELSRMLAAGYRGYGVGYLYRPQSSPPLAFYGLVFSWWRNAVTEMTSTDRMW